MSAHLHDLRDGPWLAIVGALLVGSACGSTQPPLDPPKAPSVAPPYEEAPLVSPGQFVRFPECTNAPCRASAKLDLGHAGCLILTGGERWLAGGCSEPADRAASDSSPVPLAGVARTGDSFTFVDRRGGIHVATSPLGEFVSHVPAPAGKRLHTATVAAVGPLAFGAEGALRHDAADGWLAVPGAPTNVIAAAAIGTSVLALQSPERLFRSDDGGKTYQPLALPTRGATSVLALAGDLVAPGPEGSVEWKAGGAPADTAAVPSVELSIRRVIPAFGARAPTIAIGGTSLYVVDDGSSGVTLTSGPMAGPWKTETVAELTECDAWALAAREPLLALGCVRSDEVVVYLREGSSKPVELGRLGPGAGARLGLDVSASGQVIATGVCATKDPGCAGSVARLAKGDKPKVVPSPLKVEGWRPALSADGTRAYALASDDEVPHLLVSRDGGLTFAKRSLADLKLPAGEEGTVGPPAALDAESLVTLGDDGELGVRLSSADYGGYSWAVMDSDGVFLRASAQGAWVAGYGKRAIRSLIHYSDDGQEQLHFEESEGEEFEPLPMRAQVMDLQAVACGRAGCVLGAAGVRGGWGPGQSPPSPPQLEPGAPPPLVLSCELDTKSKPAPLRADQPPSLSSVGHADVAFWTLQRAPDVRLSVARVQGGALKLSEKVLLPALPPRTSQQVYHRPTGLAVVRSGERGSEIVWEDVAHKRSGRYSLAKEEPVSADLASDGSLLLRVAGALHVVAPGGSKKLHQLKAPPASAPAKQLTTHVVVGPDGPTVVDLGEDAQGGLLVSLSLLGAPPRPIGLWRSNDWTEVDLTALDGKPAAILRATGWGTHATRLEPNGTLGPLEPMPDVDDLASTPRACTAAERGSGPRVALSAARPLSPKRWIHVAGLDEAWTTAALVLGGTSKSPCIAAMLGEMNIQEAVVLDGDGARGWLVRLGATGTVQALGCKPDPLRRPPED